LGIQDNSLLARVFPGNTLSLLIQQSAELRGRNDS
jgi:hypothetical protein